jgi:hypothetical protein
LRRRGDSQTEFSEAFGKNSVQKHNHWRRRVNHIHEG